MVLAWLFASLCFSLSLSLNCLPVRSVDLVDGVFGTRWTCCPAVLTTHHPDLPDLRLATFCLNGAFPKIPELDCQLAWPQSHGPA
jgi:hypothetical protein